MIDIHSHLLPGVDDGSPSVDVSLSVLRRFAGEGVHLVVCTPHLRASEAARADHVGYAAILEDLRRQARESPALEMGWEIMLDVPGVDLTARSLGLAGSSAVLVEFPRLNLPRGAAQELARLRSSGIVPVVAHPERYWGCSPELVRAWRHIGVAIQMDAAMLLGTPAASRLARDLLEEGLVDCLASDNHGDGRSMAGARDWLVEIGAEEQAQLLTRANAERLLADQMPLPVSPIPMTRGMLSRLRDLVLGRR